jgi:hypothetical protein
MDDNELVTVDFVFPPDHEVGLPPVAGVELGAACVCGENHFVLANEMLQDKVEGLPASRMYECTGCGKYSLG